MRSEPLACACCGYRTLDGARGGYEICQICFWEDDPVQVNDPHSVGGANAISLVQAQEAYQRHGASEPRFADRVREIDLAEDERDPAWRPYVDALDTSEPRSAEHLDWPRVYWLEPQRVTGG